MVAVQMQDLIHGLELPDRPSTSIEEYSRFYQVDVNGQPGHDQYMYLHPNGVCCVGVTKQHPLVKAGHELKDNGTIRVMYGGLENVKSGTGKKKVGDKWLNGGDLLCKVVVGEQEFEVWSIVRTGKLMGCNEQLRKDPWKVIRRSHGEGHLVTMYLPPRIVTVLPKDSAYLTPEAYAAMRNIDVGQLGLA